jgi:hypothetical protein
MDLAEHDEAEEFDLQQEDTRMTSDSMVGNPLHSAVMARQRRTHARKRTAQPLI